VALALILGPAHAGKIADLYARYLAELAAGRSASLVVPSSDVKRQTQRELLERAPAIIGADVVDFDELFERILRLTGDRRPVLRGGARQILLRRVLPEAPESIGMRLQRLGSALLDPAGVRAAGDPVLAEQYARWWTALDEEQVIDRGRMRIAVIEALRTDVAAWPSGEALFAQGFDDLSPAQEELLRLVAQRAEVVLSLTYEAGRAPFQVLTPVVGRLAELAGPDGILELPAAAFARQPDLIALERRFGEPAPDARCAASTTGGVALFEAEGERGEAELVTREVAEALRDGTPGHRIAVIAPRGAADRLRLVRQLREAGLEVDAAEERPLVKTPFGRALLALLALAWADVPTDADRLTWLRSPWSGAPVHLVERIERPMRRSQETLDEGVKRLGEPIMRALAPPAGARGAATAVGEVEAATRGMLQRAHGLRAADDSNALRDDVAVATVVLAELERLAAVEPAPTRAEVREQLVQLSLRGRRARRDAIRILDPRAARTVDVDVAIVLGLEEQALGATAVQDPLVELPEQGDVARHLAYMAITRPRRRLVLLRRISDDEGRPLAPTAIWEDLVVAAAGSPTSSSRWIRRRRSVSAPAASPGWRRKIVTRRSGWPAPPASPGRSGGPSRRAATARASAIRGCCTSWRRRIRLASPSSTALASARTSGSWSAASTRSASTSRSTIACDWARSPIPSSTASTARFRDSSTRRRWGRSMRSARWPRRTASSTRSWSRCDRSSPAIDSRSI
jgi:hypothetical protein